MLIRRAAAVLVCLVTFATLRFNAQEFTRTELGISSSVLPNNRLQTNTDAGIGGRFAYNLSPSFALESEANVYLTGVGGRPDLLTSGRAISFLAGPKAGVRRRNFGLFLKSRFGVVTFSDVVNSSFVLNGQVTTSRRTHAALDLGGVAEFYPSERWVLRVDLGELLQRYGDSTLLAIPGLTARTKGLVADPLHITVSASYRLGRLRTTSENSPAPSPLQFGVQYSLQTLQRDILTVRDESSVGGWLTYALSRHFALDAAAGFFPREDRSVSFQQGGQIIQAVAGVRWGVRRDRWGVFAKFRPGVQIYTLSSGFDFRNLFSPDQALPSYTSYAFDSGGIFEVYTSKHTMFRFDAGDTEIHFRKRHFLDGAGNPFTVPAQTRPSIQLTAGFGFRL